MTHTTGRDPETWSRLGLAEALRWAVPLKAAELLRLPPGQRRGRLPYGTVAYLGAGDALMFKGKTWKTTALGFDALAWALAYLAVSTPGGATFLDVHWCVGGHDGCPHDDRPADTGPVGPWWEPLAELARAEGFPPPAPASPMSPPAPRQPAARTVETLHLPPTP